MLPVSSIAQQHWHELNPFVAADISIVDRSLGTMFAALRIAAAKTADETGSHFLSEAAEMPIGSHLSDASISQASFDEGAMERLCDEYVVQLSSRKIASAKRYDPVLIADLILDRLQHHKTWHGSATIYAHNWKIARQYKLNGWHLLVPLLIAFRLGLPRLAVLRSLYHRLDQVAASNTVVAVAEIERAVELDEYPDCGNLVRFCAANRWDICESADKRVLCSTRSKFPRIDLLAHHGGNEGWFDVEGLALRHTSVGTAISYNGAAITNFMRHHGCKTPPLVSSEQLALNAIILQHEPENFAQGMSECVHRVLIQMLDSQQTVVSIGQLRQRCALPGLRLNPHSILPGRVLVYAPSARFLEPNAVSFVLREWVQDSQKSRARIAPDRVLTPLAPIDWQLDRDTLVRDARASPDFRNFGIAFWPECRPKMGTNIPRQARAWTEYHFERQVTKAFREAGLHRVGNVILDQRVWGHLVGHARPLLSVENSIAQADEYDLAQRTNVISKLRDYSSR